MGKGKRIRATRQQEMQSFKLSKPQEKAMMKEINAQILERDKGYWLDLDACVLWTLHSCFGFGATRLKRFFDAFNSEHERMRKSYEIEDSPWLCRYFLKRDLGVDVAQWEQEAENKKED